MRYFLATLLLVGSLIAAAAWTIWGESAMRHANGFDEPDDD